MSILRMTAEQASAHQARVKGEAVADAAAPAASTFTMIEGFRRARHWWVCMSCLTAHAEKVAECCKWSRVQHCASGAEANRLRELILLQRAGRIHSLRCQPEYECIVNGILICTYRADFAYTACGPEEYGNVVEDVKGSKKHQDRASALRRRLAEVTHAIVVRLV